MYLSLETGWSSGGHSNDMTVLDKDVAGTYVVTGEVVDLGLGKHGVVWKGQPSSVCLRHGGQRTLKLTLAERRGVASNDDELGLSRSEGLEGGLVSKGDLSRLHHKRKARVDAVSCRGVSGSAEETEEGKTNWSSWSSW